MLLKAKQRLRIKCHNILGGSRLREFTRPERMWPRASRHSFKPPGRQLPLDHCRSSSWEAKCGQPSPEKLGMTLPLSGDQYAGMNREGWRRLLRVSGKWGCQGAQPCCHQRMPAEVSPKRLGNNEGIGLVRRDDSLIPTWDPVGGKSMQSGVCCHSFTEQMLLWAQHGSGAGVQRGAGQSSQDCGAYILIELISCPNTQMCNVISSDD